MVLLLAPVAIKDRFTGNPWKTYCAYHKQEGATVGLGGHDGVWMGHATTYAASGFTKAQEGATYLGYKGRGET
uniref:Uncharacterized protein n=1 Tax=Oryza punctata TaxID=4537 RepID=A0A0E0L3C8_ORYPU